jgi:hypothetical protein
MDPETSVDFSQLTRLIACEDFIDLFAVEASDLIIGMLFIIV